MTTFEIVIITALSSFILLYIALLFITAPTYECSRTDKGKSCCMDCEGCKDFKQINRERALHSVRLELIDEIQQQVRMLKNSETHVCPGLDNPKGECSCRKYEQVIDELDKLKEL